MVRERFIAIGFPAEFADAYIAMLAEAVDHPALVTHDVEKILGRPAQYVRAVGWTAHRNLFTN